eukprot:GABV01001856.1.p3 GENE.GABV01001856.1~~GABV01001856.1.p3  ORF type:complete len:132 (-),score=57.55 GABV01001856.1:287-682(-)
MDSDEKLKELTAQKKQLESQVDELRASSVEVQNDTNQQLAQAVTKHEAALAKLQTEFDATVRQKDADVQQLNANMENLHNTVNQLRGELEKAHSEADDAQARASRAVEEADEATAAARAEVEQIQKKLVRT